MSGEKEVGVELFPFNPLEDSAAEMWTTNLFVDGLKVHEQQSDMTGCVEVLSLKACQASSNESSSN